MKKPELPKPAILFAWALLVQGAYLAGDLLFRGPATAFFFGDSLHYLTASRDLALGAQTDAGLPFHPPMLSWLLAPMWFLPESLVFPASKMLMLLCNAATTALFFVLLQKHLSERLRAFALPVCLLLPLGFGELQLSSVVNNESVYRLLLISILLLGTRLPWFAGLLHAAAALTRAEHLPIALLVAVVLVAAMPALRRSIAITAGVALLVIAPYTIAVSADLRDYNERFAAQIPEPLPTIVPVSFYGPLNFALAQQEEDIFFSRRTLPITQSDAAGLDPLDPVHNEAIVHGYRLGLAAIIDDPARFLGRSTRKLLHSLRAFAHGWTWRDLPASGTWTRRPVDLSFSAAPIYELIVIALLLSGSAQLRDERLVLGVGLGVVFYRLAMNVAFFPYLRGMAIAWPFVLLCLVLGLRPLLKRRTLRAWTTIIALLAVFHLATSWQTRRYGLDGERDGRGVIIDDRSVEIIYRGLGDDS